MDELIFHLNCGPFYIDGVKYYGEVLTADGPRVWLPFDPRYDHPKDYQRIIEEKGRPLIKEGILR